MPAAASLPRLATVPESPRHPPSSSPPPYHHPESPTDLEKQDLDLTHDHSPLLSPPSPPSSSSPSLLPWWRTALDAILLLALAGLALGLHLERTRLRDCAAPHNDIGGDITGVTPRFDRHLVRFARDEDFVPENVTQFLAEETRRKWLALVPKGLGYQVIPSPSGYTSLPVPLPSYLHPSPSSSPPRTVFTTSLTHQLHCLFALARAAADPHRTPPAAHWHLPHCVDYLRQAILCAGDVALEGAATTFPAGVEGSDGWDATHVCRDYGQVRRHLEDVRADDVAWI